MAGLGELERKVMDVLWDSMDEPLTGRQVADHLPDRAYTTVLTILERLRHKHLVKRTVGKQDPSLCRRCEPGDLHGRADGRGARQRA